MLDLDDPGRRSSIILQLRIDRTGKERDEKPRILYRDRHTSVFLLRVNSVGILNGEGRRRS